MHHRGARFEVSHAPATMTHSLLLSSADQGVQLSVPSHHVPRHDDSGLNLSSCKPVQLNAFLSKSCCDHGVSSQPQNTKIQTRTKENDCTGYFLLLNKTPRLMAT